MDKFIPNTTQTPNDVFDYWMLRLKDVEYRVLSVIVRQTFGWVEDIATGRRKEKDWISRSQLIKKTGRSAWAVTKAVDSLCKIGIVLIYDRDGKLLDTAKKRQHNFNKIFYRYNQNYGKDMLLNPLDKRRV
ncbi:MAG: replication protein [Patescibacteria group bacterium]|nr:replication protein [Patescibacteria group bacterium]